MTRTIISIPVDEKRWLDGFGKRHRISSAEVVRKAVREFREAQGEARRGAGTGTEIRRDANLQIADARELRHRAVEAAGRFASGVPDLSVGHDRYLAEQPEADEHPANGRTADARSLDRKPSGSPGKNRKTR
jgi:hypothetical protein